MKEIKISQQIDRDKLIYHLQKTTQILLNIFSSINAKPIMIQVLSLVDYAKNIEHLSQALCKVIPKKCTPLQVFKKLEAESLQKSKKIASLLQNEKNLKIQLKVSEQKLKEAEVRFNQKEIAKQTYVPESFQRMFDSQKSKQKRKQDHTEKQLVSERYQTQRGLILRQKKRLSLPSLPSSSVQLPNKQKYVIKSGKLSATNKQKKSVFVDIPGEGSEKLIQHLMNKVMNVNTLK